MIELILVICSLTVEDPFYNCDEMWIIMLFSGMVPCGVDDAGDTEYTIGCAIWNEEGEPPKIKMTKESMGYYDKWGMTVLHHELKHLTCRCDHEDFNQR